MTKLRALTAAMAGLLFVLVAGAPALAEATPDSTDNPAFTAGYTIGRLLPAMCCLVVIVVLVVVLVILIRRRNAKRMPPPGPWG